MTFGGHTVYLCPRVASFAPERSENANDATRDTNKLYARKKSFDYQYYQCTRPNRTNSFNRNKCLTEM